MTTTTTPILQYEPETGYLSLTDGETRRIVCRVANGKIFLWWRVPGMKCEVPVTVEDLHKVLNIE